MIFFNCISLEMMSLIAHFLHTTKFSSLLDYIQLFGGDIEQHVTGTVLTATLIYVSDNVVRLPRL